MCVCVSICERSFPYTPQCLYCFNCNSTAKALCKCIVLCCRPKPSSFHLSIFFSYHLTVIDQQPQLWQQQLYWTELGQSTVYCSSSLRGCLCEDNVWMKCECMFVVMCEVLFNCLLFVSSGLCLPLACLFLKILAEMPLKKKSYIFMLPNWSS